MFNIGGSEMVVLGILALLVFGPEGLPGVIKTVMRTVHAFRQAAADFQHEVKTALDDENVKRDQLQRQRAPLPEEEELPVGNQEDGQASEAPPETDEESPIEDDVAEFPVVIENEVAVETETFLEPEVVEPELEPSEPVLAAATREPVSEEAESEVAVLPATDEEKATVDPSPADDEDGPSLPMATRKRAE